MRQVMVRGHERVDQMFVLTMAGYNLVRMRSWSKWDRWVRRRIEGKRRQKRPLK